MAGFLRQRGFIAAVCANPAFDTCVLHEVSLVLSFIAFYKTSPTILDSSNDSNNK